MVTVVIPIYKQNITYYEQISLEQCCKVLVSYPLTLVKPWSLNVEPYLQYHDNFRIENFDDEYFNGIEGYNRLMLSEEFYHRFLSSKFILIHQLDAFVFKNELPYWCKQEYDYIGAPWLENDFVKRSFLENLKFRYNNYKDYRNNARQPGSVFPKASQFYNRVGNGGFSFRNVKKMEKICITMKEEIDFYCSNNHHLFNEDVFWSLEVNRKSNKLRIPGYKKALKFSIESNPEYAFRVNKSQLPFGCHAWDLFPDFWRPFFKNYGYAI